MGFLDKLRDTVSVEEVSKKVTDTTNMMKLNNQMKNNEKEIDRLTFQAGRQLVSRHLHEEGTEYEEVFSMIRRLQAENQEVLAEIQRKKEEQEAARQEELRRQMEDEANTCTRCGRKNESGARFCVYCGNPLTVEVAEDAEKSGQDTAENQ